MSYLWDTNILLHYLNNSRTAKQIQKRYNLLNSTNRQVISVVSLGEIKSLAKRRNWGINKLNRGSLKIFVIFDHNCKKIKTVTM